MGIFQVGCLFFLFPIIQCNGAPRFANYTQDHMVLQRAPQRVIVWGFGDPSTLTALTINEKTYKTISQSEPTNAQNESQSNMQLTVGMIYNGSKEIANAGNFPKIRVFTTGLTLSPSPIEELLNITLDWSVASSQSIGGANWTYMSVVCYLYGRVIHQALGGRPIGLIGTSYGGTQIEEWTPLEVLQGCNMTMNVNVAEKSYGEHSVTGPRNHTVLYNAMIYPFTRIVVYGIIWYQGESNTARPDNYTCLFSKMIQYWRRIWHERTKGITDIEFPFGFVQLATDRNDTDRVDGFPSVRWQQTFDVGYVPNNVVSKVFMAVALDLRDDPHGIHPRYKHDVGYRLSRAGLAVAYGQQVEFQGPIVQNVAYKRGGQTINITYGAISGIELCNPNGFEVCCNGTRCPPHEPWTPAPVSGKSALTITLTVPNECVGKQLYGLRYLWRETPCPLKQAAIYSATDSNLPSPPYIKLF